MYTAKQNAESSPSIVLTDLMKSISDHTIVKPNNFIVNISHAPNYLTAHLWFRLYQDDMAELSTKELVQWIEYLRYAGVTKVYLYDDYVKENLYEKQYDAMKELGYLNCNLKLSNFCMQYFHVRLDTPPTHDQVTVDEIGKVEIDTHDLECREDAPEPCFAVNITHEQLKPENVLKRQTGTMDDALRWGKKNGDTWMMFFDMDEYPVIVNDTEPGFLVRFLKHYETFEPNVAELSFPDCLLLGYRWRDKDKTVPKDWLIQQSPYRDGCGLPQHKPINRVKYTTACGNHHNGLVKGYNHVDMDWKVARMHHYWGARLNDRYRSKEIPSAVMKNIVEEDHTLDPIVEHLQKTIIYPSTGYYKEHDSAEFLELVERRQRKLLL